jgi:hypothetical protein
MSSSAALSLIPAGDAVGSLVLGFTLTGSAVAGGEALIVSALIIVPVVAGRAESKSLAVHSFSLFLSLTPVM